MTNIDNSERILQWIRALLNEISGNDRGAALLSGCGKVCAGASELMAGAIAVRKELAGNAVPEQVFELFRKRYYNRPGLVKEGNTIVLKFAECTCPLARAGIDDPILCRCTVGYSKALFETLFQRPVRVTLHGSILGGDRECRQEIVIMGD